MSDAHLFKLVSDFLPAGDQPQAIKALLEGLSEGERNQVLLGVTGSGKTFTMAQVIARSNRPTLIMAPNKTLAAQLYAEMKEFFPHNAVEYFVSYYDYYQPEAYIARSDTYIEKESSVNEQIDRLRHSATQALLERRDVIVVASVSCIYGIGSVESYQEMTLPLEVGQTLSPQKLAQRLVELLYKRNDMHLSRGTFRVQGDMVEIFPSHLEDEAWRLSFFGDELESITVVDSLTREVHARPTSLKLYANNHYVTPRVSIQRMIRQVRQDLSNRVTEFEGMGKLVEAQRLDQRVRFDIEMLETMGYCSGIENYSRYLTGRAPGEPPPTLFEYLPENALLIVDESHVSVPQVRGMSLGDAVRKNTLSEYGFRLPACKDNRPLSFAEWDRLRPQSIFVSATPGPWEMDQTQGVFVEQVIRPTGLLDPVCEIKPTEHQVDDLIHECRQVASEGGRILVTTLTKKMAEALSQYLSEAGLKTRYLHSDVETLERIEIIQDLRRGIFDVLIGINLLREGLDIPECQMVAILDADKEGYLRSRTSLIQTIGRAARNVKGRVILYADTVTRSMKEALEESARRRAKQEAYNKEHGITPESVQRKLSDILESVYEKDHASLPKLSSPASLKERAKLMKRLEKEMLDAASNLEFEEAARLRDELRALQQMDLTLQSSVEEDEEA
ncbi:MAG: excinuclease ABC subunit UvrB [Alphaproteobacteria bacterium]|jgi:excinuclease ABC subunit B|nr:excinuclease ABC subunit UvrB [Alphaproteobacteria bacterium]